MKDFKKKNVLITGGSSGIGYAIAEQLISEGANIWILARRKKLLDEAAKRLRSQLTNKNQIVGIIEADVSNYPDLNSKISKIFNKNNTPDLLVNSAGVVHPGEFLSLEAEDFLSDISIDYLGTVYTTKIIAPLMVNKKSGYIVNICSIAGLATVYGYSAYSPAKAAVKVFTDTIRTELAPFNIHVSIAYPGDTDTPQLEFDNAHKPEITKAVSESFGVYSAKETANGIIKGIKRKKYSIMPSFTTKILKPFANIIGIALHYIALNKIKKLK